MISLLCPTRGRPRRFAEMCDTANQTAAGPVEIIARGDDDDPTLPDYEGVQLVGPRGTLSDMWNQCAKEASGDILMMCADDARFRTHQWDRIVEAAFGRYPDRIALIYGRDGHRDETMATLGFIHRRWYDLAGTFTWPGFSWDYADTFNYKIARQLNRLCYLPDLFIEHVVFKPDGAHQVRGDSEQEWADAQDALHEVFMRLRVEMRKR